MRKIFTLLAVMFITACASAQALNPALQDIIESYQPWGSVEFNGKVRHEKLPVTPTVRIFMVRDSLIQMSVRAPFVGEVGRLQMTPNELLVINKMKKVYCKENPKQLLEMYPDAISDIQSLFLARIVLFGQGELAEGNAQLVTIQEEEEGNWYILPQTDPGIIPFKYGYVVGKNSRTLEFMATMQPHGNLTIDYDYKNRGMQMDFILERKGKKSELEFDFDSVKWGGSPMGTVKLLQYQQVSIKEFIQLLK